MPPRALIVDDEAPAREELRFLLNELGDLVQVVGEATTGDEALVLLNSLDYDVVFLDIRMPGLSGLEVAARLREKQRRPQIIFTTAFPDYAVDAFDLSAADYLVKPFDEQRLRRAISRALGSAGEYDAGTDAAAVSSDSADRSSGAVAGSAGSAGGVGGVDPEGDRPRQAGRGHAGGGHPGAGPKPLVRIPVQKDHRTVLVDGDAIVYAAAERGYSSLKLAEEKVLVSFSLNELERRLAGHFFRVHRSHLVNLRYVRELVPDYKGALALVMNDRQRSRVEVSRRHAAELRRRLGV